MVITGLTRNQLCGLYRTVGSNPTVSAKNKKFVIRRAFLFFNIFFIYKYNRRIERKAVIIIADLVYSVIYFAIKFSTVFQ